MNDDSQNLAGYLDWLAKENLDQVEQDRLGLIASLAMVWPSNEAIENGLTKVAEARAEYEDFSGDNSQTPPWALRTDPPYARDTIAIQP